MEIGEVAERAGMSVAAVRYYESAGLLPAVARVRGRRDFTEDDLDRLRLVRSARALGLPIRDIRELTSHGRDVAPADLWARLARERLPEIERRMEQDRSLRRLIELGRVCGCSDIGECISSAGEACLPDGRATLPLA